RSVKLFDDLINLLADGRGNACGLTGKCLPQIVVEADGGVYPCDFYALDEYRVGSLAEETIDAIYTKAMMTAFRTRETSMLTLCEGCPYAPICGGGCPRMRREVCGAPEAKNCGYRMFLQSALDRIQRYAIRERLEKQRQTE
ncbi:MAG: SPASM domain-containing protein, partial [Oscillospiraceae bacterium]|nr:SPASM domain-containing protein [Oscillospiraceae bacterium]